MNKFILAIILLVASCTKTGINEPDYSLDLMSKKPTKDTSNSDSINSQVIPWNIQRVGFANYAGTNKVWILDGGVDGTHLDLNINKKLSKSFIDKQPLVDATGHGTQIAGVVGAINNNIGVVGVASGVEIVSVKILGSNWFNYLLPSIDYISKRAKSGDVVIISWTIGGAYLDLDNAIIKAANKGIYFCIAAGRSSLQESLISPQRIVHKNVFTVSAFSQGDYLISNLNYGLPIRYSQPGANIYTTDKGNSYKTVTGTSYAAPHLAGLLLINNGVLPFGGFPVNDTDGYLDTITIKK